MTPFGSNGFLYKMSTFSIILSIFKAPQSEVRTDREQRSVAPADAQTGEPWMECRVIRHCPLVVITKHTCIRAQSERELLFYVTLYIY